MRRSISTDLRDRLAFWALAGLALLVAHDATYLLQVGPGEAVVAALRTAGHGYWGAASIVLATIAIVAGAWTWLGMRRLEKRARELAAEASKPRFARRVLGTWLRLAAVVAIGFLVQENVEHFVVHGHAPGLGALIGPEYPLAIPVIGLISGCAAIIAAVVGSRREALVVAIEAALRRLLRPPRIAARPPARLLAGIGSVLATRGACRAPPALVVAIS